jgi:hypothetical protein
MACARDCAEGDVTGEGDASKELPAEASAWQRRRRLRAVFGDVLPETTQDERDAEAAEDDEAQDRWLRRQVPPHHG